MGIFKSLALALLVCAIFVAKAKEDVGLGEGKAGVGIEEAGAAEGKDPFDMINFWGKYGIEEAGEAEGEDRLGIPRFWMPLGIEEADEEEGK